MIFFNFFELEKLLPGISTRGGFQCLYAPLILIDSIYRKIENHYPKVFLEQYFFIKNKEIYCCNSDEENYGECINLRLETLKK